MNLKHNSSLTLIELIVATSLIGLIFLAAATIDVASRRFYYKTDRSAVITTSVGLVQDHMAKNILQAIGYISDSGIIVDKANHFLDIRIDQNQTPWNYADDIWVRYQRVNNDLRYFPAFPGASEIIATRILQPTDLNGAEGFALDLVNDFANSNFYLEIKITGRYTPTQLDDPYDNPQVTLTSNVSPRTMSAN